MNNKCQRYFRGGDWYCDRCGYSWSFDDDAPDCLSKREINRQWIKKLRKRFTSD